MACGLCCNGVLFADVRLQPADDPAALKQLGLPVRRRGTTCRFSQPCSALDSDGCCGVYDGRPQRCRDFECGVLKEVLGRNLTESEGLQIIRQARKLAGKVTRLLERSGNHEFNRPLTKRFQSVMRLPIDLSAGDGAGDLRGELMLAVHELMELLQQHFLRVDRTKGDASG